MKKKFTKIIFSLSVTIIIFIILFKKTPFIEVINLIEKADFRIILLVLILALFDRTFISPLVWKLILNKMGFNVSFKESLFIKVSSEPVISITPLKLGEFSRVLYLNRRREIPSDKVIFSIFVEFLLSMLVLLFFFLIGITFWFFQGSSFILNIQGDLFVYPLLARKNSFKNKMINNFKKYFKRCYEDRMVFLDKKILLFVFSSWFLELLGVYMIAKALAVDVPFSVILFYLPLAIVISSIPISFLGLGVRESIMIFFFAKFASSEKILAVSLLYSFFEYILPMLMGLSLTYLFLSRIVFVKNERFYDKVK